MIGQIKKFRHSTTPHLFGALVLLCAFFAAFIVIPALVTPALAAPGDRTLNLFYTQTGETAKITFRRNGRYDQAGLNQLNKFLRDWRRDEPTRMDPALFDLVWQVYRDVGATGPINVVSAYRSPKTNAMLRTRSRTVAKDSRHIKGQALDFFIPGVPIAKLREAAMRRQVGGVGYYPTSGRPFVHLDTGNVRAWPRMTRAQLKRLFPDGRTLHLPTDGVPLSREGRRYAMAQWQKCSSVPCVGSVANTVPNRNETGSGSGRTLLDLFFGGSNEDGNNEPAITTRVASAGPSQRQVTSLKIAAAGKPETPPIPAPRAALLAVRDAVAPPIPQTLLVATRASQPTLGLSPPLDNPPSAERPNRPDRPTPQILPPHSPDISALITAYAPIIEPEPNAQRALQMLIERRNSTPPVIAGAGKPVASPEPKEPAHPLVQPALRGSIAVASIAAVPELSVDQAVNLFDSTWNAVINAQSGQQIDPIITGAISPAPGIELLPIKMRQIQLTAPDLEHVAEAMVAPTRFSGPHFAVMFEPDQGDFDPATELGPLMGQINFELAAFSNLETSRFTLQAPQLVTAL